MAWRIVIQPNGLYARFSDVVEDFTCYDLTREEAIEVCKECPGVGALEAEEKVKRGEEAGRARYEDEIETIKLIHGPALAGRRMSDLSRPVQR